MGLLGDGTEGHGPGGKALDDRGRRLDLFEGHRIAVQGQLEETAQGQQAFVLIVDGAGKLLEGLPVVGAGGVLELGDGIGCPGVGLATDAESVVAAHVQGVLIDGIGAIGVGVPARRLLGDLPQANALDAGGRAGEIGLDEITGEPDGVEDLGAAVGLIGRDAHLGHDLEQPLLDALHVAVVQFRLRELLQQAGAQGREGVKGQVRVDRLGAIAGQDGEVVHLARRPGLHHQAGLGTQAHAHQVMMYGGSGEQGRDWDVVRIQGPVREHQDVMAVADRAFRRRAQQGDGGLHAHGPLIHRVADADGLGAEGPGGVILDVADAGQVRVRQDGVIHLQPQVVATVVYAQQVWTRPDQGHQRHHQFLADGVDGRVGDLGEVLLEVIE